MFWKRKVTIMKISSVSALTLILGTISTVAYSQDSVTVVSWGGNYQEAVSRAFFQTAAAATGITVREDTLNGLADVRLQVQSGNPTWDLVELGSHECVRAASEGLLEPLDYSVIDPTGIPGSLVTEHWVGSIFFSTVIAYDTSKFGADGPQSWSDFFDVERFPGTRSLYHRPITVLEAALMADGVAPADLYPLDVDRAFAKLEKIKDHVAVWWTSGGQSGQLAKDKAVDMLMTFNGRIEPVIADGGTWSFTFNQGILDYDCYGIPKGSANVAAATRLLAEIVKPETMANLPTYINYGPANALAFETGKIAADIADAVPSSPAQMARQVIFGAEWWQVNEAAVQERWDAFIQ